MSPDNPYFLAALAIVLGMYLLQLVVELLDLRSFKDAPPKGFEDIYDQERYRKSQRYHRDKARLDLLESSLTLVFFLAFWLLGGIGWADGLARSLGLSDLLTGLVFFSAFMLVAQLASIPFSLYDTFVIEGRYGFNRTTPGTFALDRAKSLVLSALLGLPILALVLFLFDTIPHAWLYAWLALTLIQLALLYLYPRFIMPWFNKFEPLEDEDLKGAIQLMAKKCDFPLKEVFQIDGSRRSSKGNAFFVGFGKNRRIALFDTLIEKHSTTELVAVLAHEIGHFKRRHIWQMIGANFAQTALLFFALGLILHNRQLFDAFGVAETSTYLSLFLFTILYQPVSTLIGIATSALSRKNEFEADRYAAQVTGRPQDLIDALKRLSADQLANLTPHPLAVWLSYSHPPLPQRVAALQGSN